MYVDIDLRLIKCAGFDRKLRKLYENTDRVKII